jgi:hypothetical protein
MGIRVLSNHMRTEYATSYRRSYTVLQSKFIYTFAVLRIRIRMDPHQIEKYDSVRNPHHSDKLDLEPHPHQLVDDKTKSMEHKPI